MSDIDIESLARRAGVDGLEYKNWYPAPAVALMLAQMRREVLEEAAKAVTSTLPMFTTAPPGSYYRGYDNGLRDAGEAIRRLVAPEGVSK